MEKPPVIDPEKRTYDKQVVDLVLDDAKRLQKQLGYADKDKLDQYMDSVFSIERRIRHQKSVGCDKFHFRCVRPSRQKRFQHTSGR